ncbi:putative TIGR02099 family protein [Gammaproteobacteria bacterium]
MIRLLGHTIRHTRALAILLLLISGLMVSVLRIGLPWLDMGRPFIEEQLSRLTGLSVRIGGLSAYMEGLVPQLTATDIRLVGTTATLPVLRVANTRIGIDLWRSLKTGRLQLKEPVLQGLRLVLRQNSDGSFQLGSGEEEKDRSKAMEEPGDARQAAALTFFEGRLRLEDSEVVWEMPSGLHQHFQGVRMDLVANAERLWLDASAQVSSRPLAAGSRPAAPGSLRFQAEILGGLQREAWVASGFMDFQRLPMVPGLEQGWQDFKPLAGHLSGQAWFTAAAGYLLEVTAALQVQDLALSRSDGPAIRFPPLASEARWRSLEDNGWELALADLHLGQAPPATLLIRHARKTLHDVPQWMAALDGLDINNLAELSALLPPPLSTLTGSFAGRLEDLRLAVSPDRPPEKTWAMGRLTQVEWSPVKPIPGIRGLSTAWGVTPGAGFLTLQGQDAQFLAPWLFRQPLALARLDGHLAGRLDDGALTLSGQAIEIANADLETSSRLELRLPITAGGRPFLDLQTDFQQGNARHVKYYLPAGIMDPELTEWLDRAFIKGTIPRGRLVLHGELSDFPYDKAPGHFEVQFGVSGLDLDYKKGWPVLKEIDGEVRFLKNSLDVTLQRARLLSSRTTGMTAHIRELDPTSLLEIRGATEGPTADGLTILRDTPLARETSGFVEGLTAQGSCWVDLDLAIPLKAGQRGQLRTNGAIHWDPNRDPKAELPGELAWPAWPLVLKQIKGTLEFSRDGLKARHLEAQTLGSSLVADINSQEGVTDIQADLSLSAEQLDQRFPSLGLDQWRGASPWHVALRVGRPKPPLGIPLDLVLTTDLSGTAIPWPAPLGKTAQTARSLRIQADLTRPLVLPLAFQYGAVTGSLELNGPSGQRQLDRGAILLGEAATPVLPDDLAVTVQGHLAEANLKEWLALSNHLGQKPGAGLPQYRGTLGIAELHWGLQTFAPLKAQWEWGPKARWIALDGPDLKGRIAVPAGPSRAPVTVALEQLSMRLPEGESDLDVLHAGPAPESAQGDPRQLPGLRVKIDALKWNGTLLGQLTAVVDPEPLGLRLDLLNLKGPLIEMRGEGQWRVEQGHPVAALKLTGHSENFGQLRKHLGYGENIAGASADATLDLTWPGSPEDFGWGRAAGLLGFHLKNGRFLEASPGVGRVFGLLNLEALRRRLSLDFSDLFRKGYAFDRLEGRFRIGEGQATTEDVVIEGPAARVALRGRTGLVARDYDQQIQVRPRVSTSLPVAGALVGGPLVGATLLLAQQVLGDQVDRIAEREYRLTGTWDAPVVTPISPPVVKPDNPSGASQNDLALPWLDKP